jgi:protein phosphatase
MKSTGLSCIGKVRNQNQDSIFFSADPVGSLPNLFIVADGMGGHNAGDVASKQAVEKFLEYIRTNPAEAPDFLDLAVSAAVHANACISEQARQNPGLSGMGTTFSACFLIDKNIKIVHVGDSRVYAVLPGNITILTQDHSFVHEMVKAGQITPEEARTHPKRNILLRVMGGHDNFEADAYSRGMEDGCVILLCSDGLYDMLTDDEIMGIVNSGETLEEKAQRLIDAANAAGGKDNISVILINS